jgi:protein subunit release factor A
MTIEIRAGEGGADAQLFVADLLAAYVRMLDAHD